MLTEALLLSAYAQDKEMAMWFNENYVTSEVLALPARHGATG